MNPATNQAPQRILITGDPTQRQPDIAQAQEILGWQPHVALDDGLPRTIDYFRTSPIAADKG